MKKLCRASVAALLFILCDRNAFGQDKIRLGLSSVSALHSAVWVAEQKGFFRKQGLDPEIIVTGQGATVGIGGLLANDIQIASAGGDALVNAALRGGETVMIAAVVNQGLNRILVRPDIKTSADLKGKKIGVTRIGAISHSVLLMMLKRWNMSPTDLQVMQLGSSPNMLAGLDKGGIDGAVMTIPFVFVAEDRGFRVLVDLAEMDIYYLHTMIASTRSYIRANHDKVVRFLKGFLEGIAYFSSITSRKVLKSSERSSASTQTRKGIWNDLTSCWRQDIMIRCPIRRSAASRRCSG
jgi:ABC-type nitrate/sulfonate/bicarbonate transport system substrate-binding protein